MGTWEDELKLQKWRHEKEERGELLDKNTSLLRFTRWPNPLNPYVDDIEVLLCNNDVILLIKGAALAYLYWAFTTFVPSPVEIGRKIITGGYGCGFYLLPEIPSPLDIIGSNRELTKLVAKVTRPATTALFYLWGQQAIFSALAVFQSLIYAARRCDDVLNEIELGGADTPVNSDTAKGGIGLIDEIWDPNNWKTGLGGEWSTTYAGGASAWWAFGLLPVGIELHSFNSWIEVIDTHGTRIYDYQEAVVAGPNPTVSVVHTTQFPVTEITEISLRFSCTMTLLVPLGRLHILTNGAGGTGPLADHPNGNDNHAMTPWEPNCGHK